MSLMAHPKTDTLAHAKSYAPRPLRSSRGLLHHIIKRDPWGTHTTSQLDKAPSLKLKDNHINQGVAWMKAGGRQAEANTNSSWPNQITAGYVSWQDTFWCLVPFCCSIWKQILWKHASGPLSIWHFPLFSVLKGFRKKKIDLPGLLWGVTEIDNPYKLSLCEPACVSQIVHFVN